MLYGYLLYLNAFLDSVGSRSGAERTGGPRRRFRRDRVLVDVAAGPVTGSRVLPTGLLAVFLLAVRELLLFLERGTPGESGVRRRWLLRGPRTIGGLDGASCRHR